MFISLTIIDYLTRKYKTVYMPDQPKSIDEELLLNERVCFMKIYSACAYRFF